MDFEIIHFKVLTELNSCMTKINSDDQ